MNRFNFLAASVFCLWVNLIAAQENGSGEVAQGSRLLNIGFKAGACVLVADPAENALGQYASNRPLFDLNTYQWGLEAQLFRLNGFGVLLETGFRRSTGSIATDMNTRFWEGNIKGEFGWRSIYLKPGVIYNYMLGERWILMGSLGAEWHINLDPGRRTYYGDQYALHKEKQNLLLNTGLEIRTWLNATTGLSLYFNYLYSANPVAKLYGMDSSDERVYLGSYTGSGIDIGFKLSKCFSCLD